MEIRKTEEVITVQRNESCAIKVTEEMRKWRKRREKTPHEGKMTTTAEETKERKEKKKHRNRIIEKKDVKEKQNEGNLMKMTAKKQFGED